jgi:hypothetical protein
MSSLGNVDNLSPITAASRLRKRHVNCFRIGARFYSRSNINVELKNYRKMVPHCVFSKGVQSPFATKHGVVVAQVFDNNVFIVMPLKLNVNATKVFELVG